MAKAFISAHSGRVQKSHKPFLSFMVKGLDENEFNTVKNWFVNNHRNSYCQLRPKDGQPGELIVDFEVVEDARCFIEFLAGEIGVQYNIDSLFADKVTAFAIGDNYKVSR